MPQQKKRRKELFHLYLNKLLNGITKQDRKFYDPVFSCI